MSTEHAGVGASDVDEARNRAFGAGLVDDPYPTYHRLIAGSVVQPGTIVEHFPQMEGFAQAGGTSDQQFSVHTYDACNEVFRRSAEFSSSWYASTLGASIGQSIIEMDAPEHRRMRLLLQPAFSRREIDRWRSEFIESIVDEHFDEIVPKGHADLYADIAAAVPVHTISAALGLPVEDRDRFFDWAIRMTSSVVEPMERHAASLQVADYIAPLVAERRTRPRQDLISLLVQARITDEDAIADDVDQRPLDDDEIATFVRLLIIAGAGTTYRAYGNLMFQLLHDPAQLDRVRADRSLVPVAIEESLRLEQPIAHFGRVASVDSTIDGVAIPAGCVVNLNIGAANHDPTAFADPERFDLDRHRPDRHLTFGFGVHRCLGIHLARAELTVLLERTLDRLVGLRLDPAASDIKMTGLGFRMVTRLPVLFARGD